MAMKTLEYLRGISDDDSRKLRARGIRHTNQLLHATTLDIDRQRLASRTGISADRLLSPSKGRRCRSRSAILPAKPAAGGCGE